MEFLGVEDFDEHRKRSCCPFHSESTPSFIYDAKRYACHCFGACGTDTDIVDAYMRGQNKSFVEAVQKLFELTDTVYSFGEHGVKTRREYRYPKPVECESKEVIYKYLGLRCISNETADYLDLRQDEHGNIAFNYYDLNDVLVMVKYRPSHRIEKKSGEAKNWCQKDADTTPILFNINRINPERPLVIASGELDCAALIESGVQNSVSIPLGDGNLAWIEECWSFLEQFKEIIIVPDNDESGAKYCKTVLPRLGSWRCKVAHCPEKFELPSGNTVRIKDVNETLVRCGKDAVVNMIANATDSPIPSVIDFSDVEEKDLSSMDGIETGIIGLDKEIMRLFYGSLQILSGIPGSGKTSWLYQVICNALDQGVGAWLFSRELPEYMTVNWMNYLFAGPRNVNQYVSSNGATYYKVKPEAKKLISEYYRGSCHIYRDGYSNAVEEIQSSMEDSARKFGTKLFVIDNLMTVDLHADDSNKFDKQTEFVNWLIQFSSKFDVCTILVAHPRKLQYGQDNMDMYDVAGTSNLVNLAHRGFGLKRVTPKEREGVRNRKGDGWEKPPCKYNVRLTVLKDRFRGRANLELGMYYDVPSRRFFSSPEEYDHQYKWDTNTYTDTLEYPVEDSELDQLADKEIYVGNKEVR
ncbi:DNA primase [bioreactor metagenome]|uniref:DNA primase n=1 Tax=bioreactor metagenome TaxID=1076179 RepID=A0A644XD98_9ZZZZ